MCTGTKTCEQLCLLFGQPGGFQPHWVVVDTGVAEQWIPSSRFYFPRVLRIAGEEKLKGIVQKIAGNPLESEILIPTLGKEFLFLF